MDFQGSPCEEQNDEDNTATLPPKNKSGVTYTDNSLEFMKVCEGVVWNHDKSTSHTNPEQMASLQERSEER